MKKQLIALSVVIFSVTAPLKASAAKFSQFYAFGDSLSDTGNAFIGTGGKFPVSPAYFNGRFSNGPIWVDYVGEKIGLTPTPFAAILADPTIVPKQGINFAIGGAQTGISSQFPGTVEGVPGLRGQVGLFAQSLIAQNLQVDAKAIFSVNGGGNDYFDNKPVSEVIDNLYKSINTLAGLGAKNIVVFNQSDIGKVPFAKVLGRSDELSAITLEHNQKLALALDKIRSLNPGTRIASVDLFNLFEKSQSVFQDSVNPCITGNSTNVTAICSNPDDFLFYDDVHPTTRAHRFIASATLTAIPEPSVGLGIFALATLAVAGKLKRKKVKQSITVGKV